MLGWPVRARREDPTGVRVTPLLVLVFAMARVGCGHQVVATDVVTVELTTTPALPVAGDVTRVVLTLRDRARQPVRGATLRVEAFMSHPGMAPVIATAVERADGVYDVQLELTMSGDWIMRVAGTLPDGRPVNQQIEVATARPAG